MKFSLLRRRLPLQWLRAAALLGVALATAAAVAQAIVVRDDRGLEHRFAKPPQRIITMLPSLTETAWALGVGSRLVGVDRFSDWPAEVVRLPHLGGLDDAQIEAIATLKPDVILASTASRAMERLEALGFSVIYLKSETHADVHRTVSLIARLLGTPEGGAQLWDNIQRQIATAAARVPVRLRGQRVYFEIGGGPYAAGTSSFVGETLSRLGMANIVPGTLGPFPKLNPEYVVRARPDIIMGEQREQAALTRRPGWASLSAVRDKRLCGFDAADYEMLVRPGPRMGQAAERLADCLVDLDTTAAR